MVQHWLVWSIVTSLLMLGAWMKMGSYLFFLGLAALLALGESICNARLSVQIVSFVASSCVLALLHYACVSGMQKKRERSGGDQHRPAS